MYSVLIAFWNLLLYSVLLPYYFINLLLVLRHLPRHCNFILRYRRAIQHRKTLTLFPFDCLFTCIFCVLYKPSIFVPVFSSHLQVFIIVILCSNFNTHCHALGKYWNLRKYSINLLIPGLYSLSHKGSKVFPTNFKKSRSCEMLV